MLNKERISSVLFLLILTAILSISCSARAEKVKVDKEVIGTQAVCPVTGDRFTIHESTPVLQYRGEKYYMCCPRCDTEFMKNPETYIELMHKTEPVKTRPEEKVIGTEVICPVTGNQFTITESTPVVEYQEKKYYFCCTGCDAEFIKEPKKYTNDPHNEPRTMNQEQSTEEIMYWTCSMHPEVRADREGNCPICGMALIPVYKDKESKGSLHLEQRDRELAGIKTVPVTYRQMYHQILAVGSVAYDPELVIAQEEYVTASEMVDGLAGSDDVAMVRALKVVENAEYKLRLMGMDKSEIEKLKTTKRVERSLVMPEHETWIYADVYESDIAWIKKGQDVIITSVAYPGEEFQGKIRSINPTLDPSTRSVRVRIQLVDTHMKLKPGMYVDARIRAQYIPPTAAHQGHEPGYEVLTIPRESVLDTGKRKVVWVYTGDGNFQPREVQLGPLGVGHDRGNGTYYYPVLAGLRENELVVTNGNFLIDSESQISGVAALGYGGAMGVSPR